MGLDMYLEGEKFYWTDWNNPARNLMEDGFQVNGKTLRLGYWRKHPNLHGLIVRGFADGVDNCEPVRLSADDLHKICEAVKTKQLPETDGFFFGKSDGSEDTETLAIVERAIAWVETKEPNVSRSVAYRASW